MPSHSLQDWHRSPDRVQAHRHIDADNAVAWVNEVTDEVAVRCPLLEDNDDLPEYGAYSYVSIGPHGIGMNRSLLFRGDNPDAIDDRLTALLAAADTPSDPDRLDTALERKAIRRRELTHVASLEDWAHLTGGDYYLTEKIGNRKRSSGDVAIFNGGSGRGKGAYVALASENGPRGRNYLSVGIEPAGYYTLDRPLPDKRAFEISRPQVTFDGDSIHVEGPESEVTITATTDNPDHCLYDTNT